MKSWNTRLNDMAAYNKCMWRIIRKFIGVANNAAFSLFGLRITKNKPFGFDLSLSDSAAHSILKAVVDRTMTDENRLYNLILSVRHLIRNSVKGDFIECGVWRGGSMMAMAMAALDEKNTDRNLFLYDTFSGMTKPTSVDVDYEGVSAMKSMEEAKVGNREFSAGVIAYASIGDVKKGMESTKYPTDKIFYIVGDVSKTLRQSEVPNEIALLRLDTDWYESTKVELEILWPRLVPGGILILDDYDHWVGARRAVDEYFQTLDKVPLLMRMQSGRIAIKS
jgi:O-methyltransferase